MSRRCGWFWTYLPTTLCPYQQILLYLAVLSGRLSFLQGLDRQQIGTIVRLQAKRVADRLASRKIKLELDDAAVEWLADKVCTSCREYVCHAVGQCVRGFSLQVL